MRNAIDLRCPLGSVPIEKVRLDQKSRNGIPAHLVGLHAIYKDEETRISYSADREMLEGDARPAGVLLRPGLSPPGRIRASSRPLPSRPGIHRIWTILCARERKRMRCKRRNRTACAVPSPKIGGHKAATGGIFAGTPEKAEPDARMPTSGARTWLATAPRTTLLYLNQNIEFPSRTLAKAVRNWRGSLVTGMPWFASRPRAVTSGGIEKA